MKFKLTLGDCALEIEGNVNFQGCAAYLDEMGKNFMICVKEYWEHCKDRNATENTALQLKELKGVVGALSELSKLQ